MDAVRFALQELPLWAVGLLLIALLFAAAALGRAWRARVDLSHKEPGDPSVIISASLGLMALLLGFTVSMAVNRFDNRRAAVVQEANAIGTFLLRADLMPADERMTTLQSLDRYVDARTRVAEAGMSREGVAEARRIAAGATAEMWNNVLDVRESVPDPAVKLLLVESANMMFDMGSARDAAIEARLPSTLVLLLVFFPAASMVLIGYASGKAVGAHFMASTEMIVLLTLTLLLVLDLDRPRSGTILTNEQPLMDVQEQVKEALSRTPTLALSTPLADGDPTTPDS
jgi:hypothetical protein